MHPSRIKLIVNAENQMTHPLEANFNSILRQLILKKKNLIYLITISSVRLFRFIWNNF